MKNVVMTQGDRCGFLGVTRRGGGTTRNLAEPIRQFPGGTVVLGDSGFQGWHPARATVIVPVKKPRGGELASDN